MKNRALFLDRDGVINIDYGYVHKKEQFKFINGIFEVVRIAKELAYFVLVVTNQSGIGRGEDTKKQFYDLTTWMEQCFLEQGAPIDKVYYSPYHPTAGKGRFKRLETTRKPGAGMITTAVNEFNLQVSNSILVGDKASDILAGMNAGVGQNLYLKHGEYEQTENLKCKYISDLRETIFFLRNNQ